MRKEQNSVTAGLVFLGKRNFDIVSIGNRVAATLEAINMTMTGLRILSDDSTAVGAGGLRVLLTVERDRDVPMLRQPAPRYLSVRVTRETGEDAARDPAALPPLDAVLAHVLKALHGALSADYIQWQGAGALLSSGDFIMATTLPEDTAKARPRRVHALPHTNRRNLRAARLPSVEETNDILQSRLSQRAAMALDGETHADLRSVFASETEGESEHMHLVEPAEEDPREATAPLRLSAWMLSFAVALLSLPVGVMLIVINLFKGENLRLSAQTAALTGTFIALQGVGATAQAMSLVQGMLG